MACYPIFRIIEGILFRNWLIFDFVLVLNVLLSFRYLFKWDVPCLCVITKLDKVENHWYILAESSWIIWRWVSLRAVFKSFWAIGGISELFLVENGVWRSFFELLCHLHSSEIQLKITRIGALKWNYHFTRSLLSLKNVREVGQALKLAKWRMCLGLPWWRSG